MDIAPIQKVSRKTIDDWNEAIKKYLNLSDEQFEKYNKETKWIVEGKTNIQSSRRVLSNNKVYPSVSHWKAQQESDFATNCGKFLDDKDLIYDLDCLNIFLE